MAALNVDRGLLDQFYKLADNKDVQRIEAAIKIIRYINFNKVKNHLSTIFKCKETYIPLHTKNVCSPPE